jgi:hypothetical protein
MKTYPLKYLLLICFTYLQQYLHAQSITLSAGVKHLEIQQGEMYFSYIDESPAPDEFTQTVEVASSPYAFNIAIDMDWYNENPLYGIGRLQGYFGQMFGFDLGGGIGFALPLNSEKTIRLHPEALLVFGFTQKNLGDLYVQNSGSVYITVNETQYDNYEPVGISLTKNYFTVKPGVSLVFPVASEKELVLHTAYQFGNNNANISFNGPVDGENVSQTEDFSEPNVAFYVDGMRANDVPFQPKGPEISIGLRF